MASTQAPAAKPSPLTRTTNNASKKKLERKVPSLKKPAEFVTLYAGESNEKFLVHKEFACFYSPVLKAAFESEFIEGQTQTYRLDDTTKPAVRLLNHWLYTQTLDTISLERIRVQNFHKNTITEKGAQDRARGQLYALLELWVLAEKLLIPTLQNMAIIEYHKNVTESGAIPITKFGYIYENTSAGSPLRLLVVDQCAGGLTTTCYAEQPSYFPHEMLIDIVTRYSALTHEDKQSLAKLNPDSGFAKFLVQETS